MFECPAQVGVISETASIRDLNNWRLRIREKGESFADASLGKMIAECVSEESAKAARDVHGMNTHGDG